MEMVRTWQYDRGICLKSPIGQIEDSLGISNTDSDGL